jgi:membrane-bound serine protease (ClpP class)
MGKLILLLALLFVLPGFPAVGEEIPAKPAYVLPVDGPVTEAQFLFMRRAVKDAEAAGAQAIILDMDTPGGDLKATEKIVQMLVRSPVPSYTYVNPNAGSAGALIALATKKIYMAPISAIGAAAPVAGSGQEIPETMNAKIVSYFSGYFRSVAEKNGYHPGLVDGFMNLDKEVKIGDEVINPEGGLLTLSAGEATREIDGKPLLATAVADDVEAVAGLLDIAADQLVFFEPSGFEAAAQWITMLAPVLLLGGIIGAYLEFKAPGFGVAGVISAICFALFFGGHYIAGLTGLEMPALFVLGIICILVELIFFPGIVVLALCGSAMVVVALFFAMADFYPAQPLNISLDVLRTPMINLTIALAAALVAIPLLAKFLPKVPFLRGLFLSSQIARGSSAPVVTDIGIEAKVSPGDTGIATTILRPAGRARIGEEFFDVLTGGEFLDQGTPVRVLAVNAGNIVVGEVEKDTPAA